MNNPFRDPNVHSPITMSNCPTFFTSARNEFQVPSSPLVASNTSPPNPNKINTSRPVLSPTATPQAAASAGGGRLLPAPPPPVLAESRYQTKVGVTKGLTSKALPPNLTSIDIKRLEHDTIAELIAGILQKCSKNDEVSEITKKTFS